MKYGLLFLILSFSLSSPGQDTAGQPSGLVGGERSDTGGQEIEQLFMSTQTQGTIVPTKPTPTPAPGSPAAEKIDELAVNPQTDEDKDAPEIKRISDLVLLSAFRDVSIVQKRFLPKTKRFEGYLGLASIMNDPFFFSFGANMRMAYYWSERYGAEFIYLYLNTTERQVTTDLREKLVVQTSSIVTPNSFMGAAFKWVPVYGKTTFLNKRIVPFDMYFNLGLGITQTSQKRGEMTIHLGTGQLFAVTKSLGVRWDFTWNFFNGQGGLNSGSALYNNLFLSVGMSFLFPGAKYR